MRLGGAKIISVWAVSDLCLPLAGLLLRPPRNAQGALSTDFVVLHTLKTLSSNRSALLYTLSYART